MHVTLIHNHVPWQVMGIKGHDEGKLFMSLLEELDRSWGVSTGEIFSAEFGVFAHLDFTLHKPYKHVFLNFNRLLKSVNMTPKGVLSGRTQVQCPIRPCPCGTVGMLACLLAYSNLASAIT
jgi:hypothetical protein